MSNHSAKYPNGILDKETLKAFFAIFEAPEGTLTYKPGWERIPDNWYRRPLGLVNAYSPASFAQDLVQIAAAVPEAVSVGGNTGSVNSFAGANLGDITGGAYQTSDLTNPKKFVCYFYQITLAIVRDFLRSRSLGSLLGGALDLLHNQIDPFVDPSCAKIGKSHVRCWTCACVLMCKFSELQRRVRSAIPWCSSQQTVIALVWISDVLFLSSSIVMYSYFRLQLCSGIFSFNKSALKRCCAFTLVVAVRRTASPYVMRLVHACLLALICEAAGIIW